MFAVRVSAAAATMLGLYQFGMATETAVTILQKNCASCHGATQMSGFDVRNWKREWFRQPISFWILTAPLCKMVKAMKYLQGTVAPMRPSS